MVSAAFRGEKPNPGRQYGKHALLKRNKNPAKLQEDFAGSGNAQAHEGKFLRIFSPVSAPLKEEFFTMRRISRIRECTHFLSEWGESCEI